MVKQQSTRVGNRSCLPVYVLYELEILDYGFPVIQQLSRCFHEGSFEFVFGDMAGTADFLVSVLLVASVNGPSVLVVGVPHLGTEEASAFSTSDFAGEK